MVIAENWLVHDLNEKLLFMKLRIIIINVCFRKVSPLGLITIKIRQ